MEIADVNRNNASSCVLCIRTAFSDRIPSEKAFGMPNVRKSYDIPIKTRKKITDQTN
jgi:hypothetical protein